MPTMKPSSAKKPASPRGKPSSSSSGDKGKSPRASKPTANPLGGGDKKLAIPAVEQQPPPESPRNSSSKAARPNSPRGPSLKPSAAALSLPTPAATDKPKSKTPRGGAGKSSDGKSTPRGKAKPKLGKTKSSSNVGSSDGGGKFGVANEEQPPAEPSTSAFAAPPGALTGAGAAALLASGVVTGTDLPVSSYATASTASLRALHCLPAAAATTPAALPLTTPVEAAPPQQPECRARIRLFRDGHENYAKLELEVVAPPAQQPAAQPGRAAEIPAEADPQGELSVAIAMGENGQWKVTIFEPDDTVEEPVAVQQQAASLTAEVPPADPIMTTTAKPTKSGLKCRIDVDDDCEKFVVTFDYFGESPRQSNLAAAAASASQPQEALASAPAAVQSKITLTPEGNPRVSIAPASAPAAESALEQSATKPKADAPAPAAEPPKKAALKPKNARPPSPRRPAAAKAEAPASSAPVSSEYAAIRDTMQQAATTTSAPAKTDEPAVVEEEVVSSSKKEEGPWVPPRLSVKLVEQVDEDQIAVSLMPNPESGAADTRLLCDAKPMPVFDVVVTQEATEIE